MTDNWFEVLCPNIETFNFIDAIGKKYGYDWNCNGKDTTSGLDVYTGQLPIKVTIHINKLELHYNYWDDDASGEGLITLDKLEETIRDLSKKIQTHIYIGGNEVKFYDGYIQVGCTRVDKDTVLKIYDRIMKEE